MSLPEQPTGEGANLPPPSTSSPPSATTTPVQLTATVIITPSPSDATNAENSNVAKSPPKEPIREKPALNQFGSQNSAADNAQSIPAEAPNPGSTAAVISEPSESMDITNPLVASTASQLAAVATDALPSVLSIAKQNDPTVVVEDLDVTTTEIAVTNPSEKVTSPVSTPATNIADVSAPQSFSPTNAQHQSENENAPLVNSATAEALGTDPVDTNPPDPQDMDIQGQDPAPTNKTSPTSGDIVPEISVVREASINAEVVPPGEDSEMKDVEPSNEEKQKGKCDDVGLNQNTDDPSSLGASGETPGQENVQQDGNVALDNEWSISFSTENTTFKPQVDSVPESEKTSEEKSADQNRPDSGTGTEGAKSLSGADPTAVETSGTTLPEKPAESTSNSAARENNQTEPEALFRNQANNAEPEEGNLNIDIDDINKGGSEITSDDADLATKTDAASDVVKTVPAPNKNIPNDANVTTKTDMTGTAEGTTATVVVVAAAITEKDLAPATLKDANDGDVDMADVEGPNPPKDNHQNDPENPPNDPASEKQPARDDDIIAIEEDEIRVAKSQTKASTATNEPATGTGLAGNNGSDSIEGLGSARTSARRVSRTFTAARTTRSGRSLGNGAMRSNTPVKSVSNVAAKGAVAKSLGSGTPVRSTRASAAGGSGAPSSLPPAEAGSGKTRGASGKALRTAPTDPANKNTSVETHLRKELRAANAVIMSQADQIEELTRALQEERINVADIADSFRSETNYSQQLSRLVRVFRELNVSLPSLTGPDWNARSVAQAVRTSIKAQLADSAEWTPAAEQRAFNLLRILLGAKVIQPGDDGANTIKLAIENEDLKREIAFWLCWDDTNVRYTRIHMDVPEIAAPEFASEVSIDFDARQGPHFLFQLLSSLFYRT